MKLDYRKFKSPLKAQILSYILWNFGKVFRVRGGGGGGSSREPEEEVGGREVLIVVAACRHAGSREGGGQAGVATLGELHY